MCGESRTHGVKRGKIALTGNAEDDYYLSLFVFGTLHTNTAPHSINRVVDVFDTTEHHKVRSQIASNLRGVISQRLFKNPNGGRTAVQEIMFINDEIAELIRQGGSPHQLYQAMRKHNQEGNRLMEDSIREAKRQGLIYDNVIW